MIPFEDTVTIRKDGTEWTVPAMVSHATVSVEDSTGGGYIEFTSEMRVLIEPLPVDAVWVQTFNGGWEIECAGVRYDWNEPPRIHRVRGEPHHWTLVVSRQTSTA